MTIAYEPRTRTRTRCAALTFGTLVASSHAAFAQSRGPATPSVARGGTEARPPAADAPKDAPERSIEASVDPKPKPPGSLVTLSLENASLDEVVHTMSVMTGMRFVVAASPKSFVANVVAPQKVTVDEAYQALLSVLTANHMTLVPSGPFSKIIDTVDAAHEAPVGGAGASIPAEDRFITYVHRTGHLKAEDIAANVLSKMTSHDGSVLAYGDALIVTDTGRTVRRMMAVLAELDVAGVEDKLWLEPLRYAIAADVKKQIDELLDLKPTQGKEVAHPLSGSPRVTRLVALDRPNALLIVGTEAGYLRLLELFKQIDVAQPQGGQMHVVMLEHAEAKKLVTALNDSVSAATTPGSAQGAQAAKQQPLGIFESPVKISAEETNNALIVTATAHDFSAIREVIRQLDQPRRQVYIEAVVMDLSTDNTTQVGAALHGIGDLSGTMGPGAVAFGGVNPMSSIALPTDPTALQGLVFGVKGPSIPVPGFLQSVIGTSSIPGIGFLIDASTVSQDSDIVQSPSVMTTDNMPAEFHMQLNTSLQRNAPSVALPSTTGAAATGVAAASYLPYSAPATQNYGKIGPMLQVTPHLNESDDIRLDVEETISDLTPDPPQGTLGTVNFIERHASTTMTVKDGTTAVIGGLVRDTVQHTATKVPLLGDIPILGVFFRSTSDIVSKANLVLVLTPHIIREEGDMKRVVEKRMEERQQFLDHYFLFRHSEAGPSLAFDPDRSHGLLGDMQRYCRQVDEEKRLAALAVDSRVVTHEPRPPLDMPAPPATDSKPAPASPPGRSLVHVE